MSYCQYNTLVKHDETGLTAWPLKCMTWKCPDCSPLRKERLKREAHAGKPTKFITFTCRNDGSRTPSEAARAIVKAFAALRRLAKKKYKLASFPFMAVFEPHKSGWPHIHVLARVQYLDQKWLSDTMKALLDGEIVDIRDVGRLAKRVNYVAKYIGKDPTPFEGCKRYWRSLDYLLPAPEPVRSDMWFKPEYEMVFQGCEFYRAEIEERWGPCKATRDGFHANIHCGVGQVLRTWQDAVAERYASAG